MARRPSSMTTVLLGSSQKAVGVNEDLGIAFSSARFLAGNDIFKIISYTQPYEYFFGDSLVCGGGNAHGDALLLELFKKHGNVLLNIDAFKIILTKLGVKPFGDFFLGASYSVSFLEIAAKAH